MESGKKIDEPPQMYSICSGAFGGTCRSGIEFGFWERYCDCDIALSLWICKKNVTKKRKSKELVRNRWRLLSKSPPDTCNPYHAPFWIAACPNLQQLYRTPPIMEISTALTALEALSSSTSTSSSGPLNALLDDHFLTAKQRIISGEDPNIVITELQKAVVRAKKDVEKGLKAWYAALGNVGKAVEEVSHGTSTQADGGYRHSRRISMQSVKLMRIRRCSLGRRRQERWIGWLWIRLGVEGFGKLLLLWRRLVRQSGWS